MKKASISFSASLAVAALLDDRLGARRETSTSATMAKKKADADKPVTLSDVGRHVAFGVICGSARPRRPKP